MKTSKNEPVLAQDLSASLKSILAKELSNLPSYLQEISTKDGLDYLLKLMSFVFPKVNNVHISNGEDSWS